jgi:hypothetical protein
MRPANRCRFDAGGRAGHNCARIAHDGGNRQSETCEDPGGLPMTMNALTIAVLPLPMAKNERRRRHP